MLVMRKKTHRRPFNRHPFELQNTEQRRILFHGVGLCVCVLVLGVEQWWVWGLCLRFVLQGFENHWVWGGGDFGLCRWSDLFCTRPLFCKRGIETCFLDLRTTKNVDFLRSRTIFLPLQEEVRPIPRHLWLHSLTLWSFRYRTGFWVNLERLLKDC